MDLSQRLGAIFVNIFRHVVPKPEDRIPLNKHTWPNLFSHIIPVLIMGYLARRPGTHIMRLLLFPIVLFTSLRAGYGYVWLESEYGPYNFGAGLFALAIIARAIEYAMVKDGMKKIGEVIPGNPPVPAANGPESISSSTKTSQSKRPLGGIIPVGLSDSIEVLCSMRGIGFEYGRGIPIPPETRSTERGPFIWATFRTLLLSFLAFDFLEATLKLTPPFHSPVGGTIFISSLPWPTRYIVSTCLYLFSGCCVISGFQLFYSMFTIFSVVVLSQSPTEWPPIFNNPWISDSLHEFWAKRWHQILRQTFLVYGGFPGRWIGQLIGGEKVGNLGMLLGTFLASGLFHEVGMYAMGHGLDWHVRMFFLAQGLLVLCERLWRQLTGKRVGGWLGRLWAYTVILVLGQPCFDAWHRRGLGGGLIIPPAISPTRSILFPLLKIP